MQIAHKYKIRITKGPLKLDISGNCLRNSATTNRKSALASADYVIVQIAVGGVTSWKQDLDIPLENGRIFQTVGDTTGPGGVFRCK